MANPHLNGLTADLIVGKQTANTVELKSGKTLLVSGTLTTAGTVTVGAGTHTISLTDNTATVYQIKEASNNYFKIDTTNSSELITLGVNTTVASSKTLAVTTADKLTVGGVIVPQAVEVSYTMLANADLADQTFFIANRAYQVTVVKEVHSVAGTDGSAVNLQVTKDTSTNAPGAGTNLLTNNTNAGFDLKGTANTVQAGTLSVTASDLQLAAGDRLAVDYAGTLTTLAGVTVTVTLVPI